MVPVTREELSELDKRIAASVARGEAAIARQEAAVAKQEEGHVRFEAIMRDWAEQAKREEAQLAKLSALTTEFAAERRDERDERRAMIEGLMRMIDRLPPAKENGGSGGRTSL
jgi:hypothetical protein